MANSGKVLALIGGILTLLGTFLFSLMGDPVSGVYVYGWSMLNIDDVFISAASLPFADGWIWWVIGIVAIFYFLSGFIQLLGVRSRIAALLGALIPLAVAVFVVLGFTGVYIDIAFIIAIVFSRPELATGIFPVSFEYSFMDLGLGAILIALGSLLALISVFMSRED
ncbi:MAG: hypothetical protein JW776_07920 [Candidatus Lokiarchaeota archaeon]|nr:hypothetical protein [Candidatus Lokiarchaeota archaeon]